MSCRFPTSTIGAIADVYDGPHATPTKTDVGAWFLSISSLDGGRLRLSESAHVSEEDFVRWTKRVVPQHGDVVFSYETRLGEAAIIPEGLRCCLGRRMGLLRPHPDKVDSRFLLYAFLAPGFQSVVRQRTVRGSTVERILLTELPGFPIVLPSLSEQLAIASVLGALDDKIELNRRTSQTLDDMLRILFFEWFVRSQAQGGPEVDLAAVSEVAVVRGGKQLDSEASGVGAVPVFGANGQMGWTSQRTHEGFVIAFGRVGANCGSLHWAGQGAWINNNASSVVPKCDPEYVLQALTAHDFVSMRRGSAQPFISNGDLQSTLIPWPIASERQKFCVLAHPARMRQQLIRSESQTLSSLRDALLPRLLSGELRVQDAEALVEEVV